MAEAVRFFAVSAIGIGTGTYAAEHGKTGFKLLLSNTNDRAVRHVLSTTLGCDYHQVVPAALDMFAVVAPGDELFHLLRACRKSAGGAELNAFLVEILQFRNADAFGFYSDFNACRILGFQCFEFVLK